MSPDDRERGPAGPSHHRDALVTTEPGGTATADQDTIVPRVAGDGAPLVELPPAGYEIGEVIGRGGMGEVVTAHDLRIGRDVAIKRMRAAQPSDTAITRFLREARIQARLDHPAIVPVHELSVDAAGRPFFTMKRLAGVTLAQRLNEGGPLQPLLRAFVDVCLAVEFAHARGVVHRDLKPANVMLGDYGEVYVLDWGIARVLADQRGRAPSHADADIDTLEPGTQTGELLGTPGYMAPEQIRGEPAGPAADLYALGSMLFEILTGEALHPRGTGAIASTLATAQQAPARRAPSREIAPELDAACHAALAESPGARPTARDLADRIQRYLDGDRDVEHRRALALEHLERARAAIASGDPEARASAILAAGHALALDPRSNEAASLVSALILEPPKVMPAALVADLEHEELRIATQRLRTAMFAVLGVCALALLLPWMHVRNWTTLGVGFGSLLAIAGAMWLASKRQRPSVLLNFVTGLVLALAWSRVLGPFVLTPIVIAGSLLATTANRWLNARPLVIAAWLVVVTMGPLVLEATGVFNQTWTLIAGGVCSTSAMFSGEDRSDALVLIISNFTLLAAVAGLGVRTSRNATEARRKVRVQAWHLGQLLPGDRVSVR